MIDKNFNVEQAQEEVNWLGSIYYELKSEILPKFWYDQNMLNDRRRQWVIALEQKIHDRLHDYYQQGVMPDNIDHMWII